MLLSIISGKSAEEILSEQKLVKMLFGLCHDVNWKVRSLVAQEMIHLIPKFKSHDVIESLLQELAELMNDEDSFVRVEAIEAFKVYKVIPKTIVVDDFEPVLMEFYENPEDELLQQLS